MGALRPMAVRPRYTVDTHALIWFITEDDRLGERARGVLLEADRGRVCVVVPCIVLAECLYIFEKRSLRREFDDLLWRIEHLPGYEPYPLNLAVVREMRLLDKLRELHDRAIVAIARLTGSVLLTKDREIAESGFVKTLW